MTRPAATSHDSVMPRGLPAVALREGSGTDSVALEVHQDSLRRLSWLALIYSMTYLTVESYGILTHPSDQPYTIHLLGLIPISISFLVWAAARKGRISPRVYPKVLIAFQLVSTFGIIIGAWGWETYAGKAISGRSRRSAAPTPSCFSRACGSTR